MWIPSLYPNKDKLILDIDVSADPTETSLPSVLSPLDQRQFKLPVKTIGLKSDEYIFAMKGKIRPAIIISDGTTIWPTLSSEPISLCIPLYTVDKIKIPQDFVIQTQAFQFPSKFYIPPSNVFGIEESISRFELTQPVHQFAMDRLLKVGKPAMLTKEFYALLKLQLARFLGNIIEDVDKTFLTDYGTIIIEEARKQGVKI